MTTFHPSRPTLLAAAIAAVLVATLASPAAAHSVEDSEAEPVIRALTFPVVGPVTYSDTWGACRGVGCSRSHKGADVFGVKLAPLVAAADGVIVSVRRTALTTAGNKVVIEDDDGWQYVYYHLNNDSPGTDDGANPQAWIIANRLRLGDRVEAGDVIGYLGDSGNAEATPSHLHFELHQPGVGAINPTESLVEAQAAGRVVPVAPLASTSAGRVEHEPVIVAWYQALLNREPTSSELFAWADRFDIDFATADDLIADLTMAPERYEPAGTVFRSYHVALSRRPLIDELRAGEERYHSGDDAVAIVGGLLGGPEFADRYGQLGDGEFVEVIYVNARGYQPSDGVRRYWLDQLAGGRPRAEMAAYFVESYGLKDTTWHALEVAQAFRAALDRLPSDDEHAVWVAHLDEGGLIVDVVAGIRD
ncbi:MAG: peptidoglycan DD-metalloendopeptidase family protein [Acidimicrobiia bacterium]|nr:peptidoglycan DD-metalloendopeptidase family protein [Acidimicrobiia bacterium]